MSEKIKVQLQEKMDYINDWNDVKITMEGLDTTIVIPDYFVSDKNQFIMRGASLNIEK